MLKYLGGGFFADPWQLIPLSSSVFSGEIAAGVATLSASAEVNRVAKVNNSFLAFASPDSRKGGRDKA